MTDEPEIALPPGPLCALCFHQPCPCCPLPYCDLLKPECCAFQCDVSIADFQLWTAECQRLPVPLDEDGDPAAWLVPSVGPWLPADVRVARGIPTDQ